MTRLAIQAQIVAILKTIAGVEDDNIFEENRSKIDHADFIAAYREDDASDIQAWFVTRTTTMNDTSESPGGRGLVEIRNQIMQTHTYTIEGFYGGVREDGSAKVRFQALLDAIMLGFHAKRTLNDSCWTSFPPSLTQLDDEGRLGGVLCHHAVLQLTAIELLSGIVPV